MVERTLERKITIIPVRDRKSTALNELLTRCMYIRILLYTVIFTLVFLDLKSILPNIKLLTI